MDKHLVKEDIERRLQDAGIQAYGFCSGKAFDRLDQVYEDKLSKGHMCPMERRSSLEALMDPSQLLAEVHSILVVLLPYGPYTYEDKPLHGKMASGTGSEDYHRLIHDRLEPIRQALEEKWAIKGKVIVDTSPLSDRALALRAGLGIIRRNAMFYHKDYGSYVHIGALLMTVDLEEEDTNYLPDNHCGQCNLCVTHCPGDAINGDGTINSNKCVSYLTQKNDLTYQEALVMGSMLYGCDVCQRVCPANKGVKSMEWPLMVKEVMPLEEVLSMSNHTFKETFKRTSSGWRGKRQLQRNALVALGNSQDNAGALKILKGFQTQSPVLMKTLKETLNLIGNRSE